MVAEGPAARILDLVSFALLWVGALSAGARGPAEDATNTTSTTTQPPLLKLAASPAVLPLTKAWEEHLPVYTYDLDALTSGETARRLCANDTDPDKVDIGNMSRDWKPSEAVRLDDKYTYECTKSGKRVTQLVVGMDGVALVVGTHHPAHRCIMAEDMGGITLAQLRWIYTDWTDEQLANDRVDMASVVPYDDGDGIKEWSDLGKDCEEVPINPYGVGSLTTDTDFVRSKVLGSTAGSGTADAEDFNFCADSEVALFQELNRSILPRRTRNCFIPSVDAYSIAAAVSADPGGIGYVGVDYYWVSKGSLALVPVASDTVRGVNDTMDALIVPTKASITDGSYDLFRRTLYMNVDNAKWPLVMTFVQYVFSEDGQQVLDNHGIVRVNRALAAKMNERILDQGNELAQYIAPTSTRLPSPVVVFLPQPPASNAGQAKFTRLDGIIAASVGIPSTLLLVGCCVCFCRSFVMGRSARGKQAPSDLESGVGGQSLPAATAALSLLPALCDDLVHLDHDLKISVPCPKLANMLCLRTDSLQGKQFPELMSESDASRFLSHLQMATREWGSSMVPSLNVNLISNEGASLNVELFLSLWRDETNQVSFVLGVCQLDEPVLAAAQPGDGHCSRPPRTMRLQRSLSSVATSTELWSGDSVVSDSTNITNVFGPIQVVFDGLSGDLKIINCSRAFQAMCDSNAVGCSFLDYVVERRRLLLWVQERVNDYLQTDNCASAFGSATRLTLQAPNRRPLSVMCTLSLCESLESQAADDEDTLPVYALLSQPHWHSSGRLDPNSPTKRSGRSRSPLPASSSPSPRPLPTSTSPRDTETSSRPGSKERRLYL